MKQFILPESFNNQKEFKLFGNDFHYLCHVIRKKAGDSFKGLDTNGNQWQISIKEIGKDSCLLSLEAEKSLKKDNTICLTLVQCLPKGKKMDLIIRQAVESGVKKIIPVLSDHAIPKFDTSGDIKKKQLRWEKIAIEAMQQSGTASVPEISSPVKMDEIPFLWNNCGPGLFFHQKKIDDNSLHACLNENFEQVYIVIGPEGGLSNREVDLLDKAGFQSIYLGANVLRAETAALYAVAAVNVILLEKSKWNLHLSAAE